jgi:peptide/nickel transport system substrate-binding protein
MKGPNPSRRSADTPLRYKGTSATLMHEQVKAVEIIDAHRLRFVLHAPWPDFLTFYATPATGAAWIVPKTYLQRVGDDGFKRHPVGLGPYRFVRFDPGVELVLEANGHYWRKTPRFSDLSSRGPRAAPPPSDAQDREGGLGHLHDWRRGGGGEGDPKLRLAVITAPVTWWMEFPEQWDPLSPWHDRRVRLAAGLAIDI